MMATTQHWKIPAAFGLAACVALCAGGCGSTGQGRQLESSTAVVNSLVEQRTATTLSTNPARAAVGVTSATEVDVPHRTMQVSSASAFLHEYAQANSRVVGSVSRGDAVTVTGESDYYAPPKTAAMDESNGKGNPALLATWSYVNAQGGVSGWIPTRALIDPVFLATSSEQRVQATLQQKTGDGGDGMFGKNKPKIECAKGVAGGATACEPNPTVAASVMARAASAPRYDALPSDYFAAAAPAPAPKVGGELATVDPQAAEAASAGSGALSGLKVEGGGLGGMLALAGVQSEEVKTAEFALKVVNICTASRAPTPLEEDALGLAIVTATIGTSPVLAADAPISNYVASVGYRVAANSSNPYPASGLEFVVVESETKNAMAMPGGVMLITTGLLKFLQSEDELAAVLGHEIAHIEERHAMLGEGMGDVGPAMDLIALGGDELPRLVEGALRDTDLSPDLKAMVVKEGTKMLLDWAMESIQEAANSAYEKAISKPNTADECAADARGAQLALAAGYDPAALDTFLARIAGLLGDYGGANYSETRPADAAQVRTVLPVMTPTTDAAARAERWSKLQSLLTNG